MLDAPAREPPLLVIEGVRAFDSSARESAPLSTHVDGRRLALVGDWGFLFRALVEPRSLQQGRIELAGVGASEALARGVVGVALAEPRLVAPWTLRRYLTESAALCARRRAAPEAMARAVIGRFGFESLAERRLGSFNEVERSAAGILAATLGEPPVLAIERPLSRVEASAHAYLDALLVRASEGCRTIVSVLDAGSRERSIVDRADTSLVLDPDHGIRPLESLGAGSVVATVSRRGTEFRAALAARGLAFEPLGPVEVLSVVLGRPSSGVPERFRITLSSASTALVLEAALEADAPLIQLHPQR